MKDKRWGMRRTKSHSFTLDVGMFFGNHNAFATSI